MKVERQSTKNYWINFGKRAKAAGMSLESVAGPVRSEVVKALLAQGYEAETKRRIRKGL